MSPGQKFFLHTISRPITLLFFIAQIAIGQNLYKSYDVSIGNNFLRNSDVKAKQFDFTYFIEDFHPDSLLQCAIFTLKESDENYFFNNDYVVDLNFQSGQVNWTKRKGDFDVTVSSDYVVFSKEKKSICYKKVTGSKIWEFENRIRFTDYKTNTGYNKFPRAFDLNSGKKKWERRIDDKFSWNEIKHLDDSTILLECSGLHLINLNNGNGWDYTLTTGMDYSTPNSLVRIGAGLGFGAIGVMIASYSGRPDFVNGICSNILQEDSLIYFASADSIISINYSGKINWTSPIPKDKTSSSVLINWNDDLLLLNTGYALSEGSRVKYGKMFLSLINKQTGERKYLQEFRDNDYANDYLIDKDILFILEGNSIYKYDILTGTSIASINIDWQEYGHSAAFIDHALLYFDTDSSHSKFTNGDEGTLYIQNKKGNLLEIDKNLKSIQYVEQNRFYKYSCEKGFLRCISNASEIIVINNSGEKIAELKLNNPQIIGNEIVNVRSMELTILDLDELK